jgi:ABC-2 type transport system permease protein
MKRYLSLYGEFFVNRLKIFLEYRVSFLIGASSTFVMQAAGLLTIWVVMRQVPGLVGWNFDEVLLLYGLVTLSRSIEHMFADNLWTVGRHSIRSGDFDRFLIRPVDPLFHLLADRFNHDGIGNFLIGLGLIVKSSLALGLDWNLEKVLCVIAAVIGGGVIFIALNLLTCVSAFWIIDSAPVTLAVHETHEFAKYPLSMYGNAVKNLLTWVIPYGLASYYPALFLLERDSSWLAFVAPVVAVVLLSVAYRAWLFGLRRYAGTGS